LFTVTTAQANNTVETIDRDADTIQLEIDLDESVLIEVVSSSDKSTSSSLSVKTGLKDIVLQRHQNKHIVKKVSRTKKPTPHTPTPWTTPMGTRFVSRAVELSSSPSFVVFLSLFSLACHLVFIETERRTTVFFGVLLMVALSCSTTSFVSASIESHSQVTIRVFLSDNIQTLTITQKNGRNGKISIVGDPSSSTPLSIKTLEFTTSTNIEFKNVVFSSCSKVSIETQGNILVEDLEAPTSGSCWISLKSGKQVIATLADGYLGSFTLSCQKDSKNNRDSNATCHVNAMGTAVKHSSSSSSPTINTAQGDTLCAGVTGYNMYILCFPSCRY